MEHTTFLDEAFNSDAEEGTPDRELLPKGSYVAEIDDAHLTKSKNGKATMVVVNWKVVEGEHKDRFVMQSIVIRHSESSDAEKFGRMRFKDIISSCGLSGEITDLAPLV